MKLKFTKMHGIGNDYIYFDAINQKVPTNAEFIRRITDRHTGVGGDGIILILPSEKAEFRMQMFNIDGSEGSMCGNGIRCLAKFCYDKKMTDKLSFTVETKAGIKTVELVVENEEVKFVKVNMGKATLDVKKIPVNYHKDKLVNEEVLIKDNKYKLTTVSVGNPHAVMFVDDLDFDIESVGPHFENSEIFPESVNTEFVKVIDKNNIKMRVWERGSGETMSCGTGSCASVYAAYIQDKINDKVHVHLKGGNLYIEIKDDIIFMQGGATYVFEGVVDND